MQYKDYCTEFSGRLSSINLNLNFYRGWRELLLDTYIRERKSLDKPYNILILAISKGFDSVYHESIYDSIRGVGISDSFVDYIKKDLQRARTKIQIGPNKSNNINFERGVKQGDPLSPILFHIVLNDLLNSFPEVFKGDSIEQTTLF